MSSNPRPLGLFDGFGVELEYMTVDRVTLQVRPIADQLIHAETGHYVSSVDRGEIEWSNELALHVVEMKTNGPVPTLAGLAQRFQEEVAHINRLLEVRNACLLPTAMHPWMDPWAETRLWPHEYNAVYQAFDRIFDCRGHGWSNLQSVHLNLPFAGDSEFGRLHAAIRILLPLIPALAASSPIRDGQLTGQLDSRLHAYRLNCARIPSLTGAVIPEPVFTIADYQSEILEPIYREIAPFDPESILQEEWVNARGAIARFERNTIEIRVVDVQECPLADLAVSTAIIEVLRALVNEQACSYEAQQKIDTALLHSVLLRTIDDADRAVIDETAFLDACGLPSGSWTAGRIWREWFDRLSPSIADPRLNDACSRLLQLGPLARRIVRALDGRSDQPSLHAVYDRLRACLQEGRLFDPDDLPPR